MRLHNTFLVRAIVVTFLVPLIQGATDADNLSQAASPATLKIVDVRPPEERKTENLSMWITSCNYDVVQIGDEGEAPARLDILSQDLEAALGTELNSSTISVSRYRIVFNGNNAGEGKVSDFAAGYSGGAGVAVAGALSGSCSKEKAEPGWYAGSEVSTPYSPFIVEIDAELNGKRYSSRTVVSTQQELLNLWGRLRRHDGHFDSPDINAALAQALHQANTAFIEQIRQR
jgi:hypothetical protein